MNMCTHVLACKCTDMQTTSEKPLPRLVHAWSSSIARLSGLPPEHEDSSQWQKQWGPPRSNRVGRRRAKADLVRGVEHCQQLLPSLWCLSACPFEPVAHSGGMHNLS